MKDREREEFDLLAEAVGMLLRDYIRQQRNQAAAGEFEEKLLGFSQQRRTVLDSIYSGIQRADGLLDNMTRRGMIGREE